MAKKANELAAKAAAGSAAALPDLLDKAAMDGVLSGDKEPFYFSLAFPNRVEGTGGIYDGYHASVLEGVKARNKALTGSKGGHGSHDRDFYFVGGEVTEAETVYKGYIPPVDMRGGSNEGLVRAVNSGTAEFSIVAEVKDGGDRTENGAEVYTAERGVPVIDLVNKGAQEQRVGNAETEQELFRLIAQGAVDYKSESGTPLVGGKVSKMFFVKSQNTENKGLAGKVLNAIAKRRNEMDEETKKALADLSAKVDALAAASAAPKTDGTENKKKNAALEEIKALLALEADADAEAVIAAIKALSESDAEIQAENAAGGRLRKNGQPNAAFDYALEKLRGVKARSRKEYVKNVLANDAAFIGLKRLNAEGACADGVKRANSFWGRG